MGLSCSVTDSTHEQQRILHYHFHTLPTYLLILSLISLHVQMYTHVPDTDSHVTFLNCVQLQGFLIDSHTFMSDMHTYDKTAFLGLFHRSLAVL